MDKQEIVHEVEKLFASLSRPLSDEDYIDVCEQLEDLFNTSAEQRSRPS